MPILYWLREETKCENIINIIAFVRLTGWLSEEDPFSLCQMLKSKCQINTQIAISQLGGCILELSLWNLIRHLELGIGHFFSEKLHCLLKTFAEFNSHRFILKSYF